MNRNFNAIWNDIQSLRPRTTIKAWSIDSGDNLKTIIQIEAVDTGSVTVSSNNTNSPRRVLRHEFEKINSRWADYCAGRYPRNQLRDECGKNSTYIIGILHHLEVQN
jgi:hypothetical protein